MYGQFHNAQLIRTERTTVIKKIEWSKEDSKKAKAFTFISLLLITFAVSTTSFAGPSQPQLPGGNGNTQGR